MKLCARSMCRSTLSRPHFFIPRCPARSSTSKRRKFKFSKARNSQVHTVEDLAFATVPQLAELIRTRKVSPLELTKMYLARLKKYGPKLNCIVTLTEELRSIPGRRRGAGNKARQLSRTAARNSLGRKRSLRHEGDSHDLGRRTLSRTRSSITTRQSSSACEKPARCWSPSFQWARWRKADVGLPA